MQIAFHPPFAHQPASALASDSVTAAAQAFEATFLSEMLKSAGLGQARQVFGGGVGEDQFASLLVQKQAEQIVKSGGIGLSQVVIAAMSGAVK